MERPPLHPDNKVYTLKPRFITAIQNWIREIRLGIYKKKKVNKSKTVHHRLYFMNFKIHLEDEVNPQVSDLTYEMVVPARAAFFAKILLEKVVKEKIKVEVTGWEELSEEEYKELLESKEEFLLDRSRGQSTIKD